MKEKFFNVISKTCYYIGYAGAKIFFFIRQLFWLY